MNKRNPDLVIALLPEGTHFTLYLQFHADDGGPGVLRVKDFNQKFSAKKVQDYCADWQTWRTGTQADRDKMAEVRSKAS